MDAALVVLTLVAALPGSGSLRIVLVAVAQVLVLRHWSA
jgi:hypothetical protein